jgi:hypothetical protein
MGTKRAMAVLDALRVVPVAAICLHEVVVEHERFRSR